MHPTAHTIAPPRRLRPVPRRDPGRLAGADLAWLSMDRPESPMVITAVLRTGAPLPIERLRALLGERLLRYPRFEAPAFRGGAGADLGRQVRAGPACDEPALRAWVARRMGRPLPLDRPLWEAWALDGPDGGALVFRIHHALADGAALVRVLLGLADDPPAAPRPAPRARPRGPRAALAEARALARLLLLPPDRRSPLRRPLSGEKRVAWTAPIPLARLKAAGARTGATVNDLVAAALSQALGDWLARHGRRPPRAVRAIIPLDLRPAEDPARLGNHFGLLFATLPVGPLAPAERLRRVQRRMARLKASPEAGVSFALLTLLGRLGPRLAAGAIGLFGRKASVVLTNVAGPAAPLRLGGAPLRDLLFWVPQAGGIGLGVSVISYAGQVRIGVASDRACLDRPEALAEGIADALAGLGV